MASVQSLDPLSLLDIFNRLSIQKLFTGGHVCVRWNAMRLNSAQDRKELVLLIGNDAKSYIDESAFQIPERAALVDDNGDVMFPDQSDVQLQINSVPTLDFARLLHAHFTNLTSLTISTRVNDKEIDSIINLLVQFDQENGPLRTLKLYSNQDNQNKNQFQDVRSYLRLLSVVNSIGSLLKLTFDVNTTFVRNERFRRINLPILAQLEEFEFNSADQPFVCLYDSITRYAVNNPRLRRIGINIRMFDFRWLLALSTELSSRFTHLNLEINNANNDRFENICLHFAHLTSLEIALHPNWNYAIFGLFRSLSNLTHLISLVINIGGGDIVRLSRKKRFYDRTRLMNFALPALKVLTLNSTNCWHENHQFFHNCNMHHVLPNVQVIQIVLKRSLCRTCNMKVSSNTTTNERVSRIEEHCARNLFWHFARCQRLRMVCSKVVGKSKVVGPRNRQWTWNEMEPFGDEIESEEDEGEESDEEEDENDEENKEN